MRRSRRKRILNRMKKLLFLGLLVLAALVYKSDFGSKIQKNIETISKTEPIPFQGVKMTEEELERKYYYQLLDKEEQQAYKEILQGVRDNEASIYVHLEDAKRTNSLFQYVLKDFPEIFWCDGTTTATSYTGDEPYTVIEPVYLYGEEEKEKMKADIAESVNEYLADISRESTDYDKILYVYETIVNTVDYDENASDNQNIYSVFVNKRSVCAGYSKASQYLLERLGVFCTYVTGTVEGRQSHAWNLVKCDGKYYYLDTTWGDPLFQQSESEEKLKNISYDYMCCNDTELRKTHSPDKNVELPECKSMEANYYVVNKMYFESYDSTEVLKKMNEDISGGKESTVLKFADEDLYREAHDDIFQNVIRKAAKNLASWYGLNEVNYRYIDDPKLNKIVIYWEYE